MKTFLKITTALTIAATLFFFFTERQAMILLFGGFFGMCQSIMVWKLPAFKETCRMIGIRLKD